MSQLTHTPVTNIELCYDGAHTPLTRTPIADLPKNQKGYWEYIVKDSFGNVLTYENSNGYWCKSTRDSFGNWDKYSRDSNGNILTYENSYHKWFKYTRDPEGNSLTREDEDGLITYLAGDKLYGLHYQDGLYKAGCRELTYDQAIEHWTERAKEDDEVVKARAVKFLVAIEKHHEGLTK